jgi:hypothetical protein
MNIGYAGTANYRAVIEHTRDVTLNVNEDAQAVIVESALMAGPTDLPVINTSPCVRGLMVDDECARGFKELYNIHDGYPATYLYGFIGPSGVSDLIELTHSTRFLTGEIGPQLGFAQGTAIACDDHTTMATKGFGICEVRFGHFTGGFCLYNELTSNNIQDSYEWCIGRGEPATLHTNGLSVCTLISHGPYPHDLAVHSAVKAPSGAEKHLYRVCHDKAEVAYAGAWGKDIFEAKRRCRKTLENCAQYDKAVQYRIDYGYKDLFVLNQDRYIDFGGVERGKPTTPKDGHRA